MHLIERYHTQRLYVFRTRRNIIVRSQPIMHGFAIVDRMMAGVGRQHQIPVSEIFLEQHQMPQKAALVPVRFLKFLPQSFGFSVVLDDRRAFFPAFGRVIFDVLKVDLPVERKVLFAWEQLTNGYRRIGSQFLYGYIAFVFIDVRFVHFGNFDGVLVLQQKFRDECIFPFS